MEPGDPDEEQLRLLEDNVTQAETAYRAGSGSFETAVRALQGVREAIRLKLDAVNAAGRSRSSPCSRTPTARRPVSRATPTG